MHTFRQDLRFALRGLRKSPGFTAAAVLTLALGIGANTTIFSVVEGVLLRPLPFPQPARLVVPQSLETATGNRWSITYADYLDWRADGVFSHAAVYSTTAADLASEGEPRRVTIARVSDDFFPTLGVRPLLGRLPSPAEFQPGNESVVVLGYGLWKSRFGGLPDVVGRKVRMRGEPVTVLGVLGPGEGWPLEAEAWSPLRLAPIPLEDLLRRDNFVFQGVARLAPGASLEGTRARLAALASTVARERPDVRAGVSVTAEPIADWLIGTPLRRALWIVLAAVGLVLAVGCVNVANLLLARATERQRELALRKALGAGRRRHVGQLLTESLLLAAAGCALGVLLSVWGVGGLVALAPGDLPRLDGVGLNWTALGFAMGVSALSALAFGLAPAAFASAAPPARALGEGGGRATVGERSRQVRRVLLASELVLSLILLAGAGLALRSVLRLEAVDPGFDTRHLVTMSVTLPEARYGDRARVADFFERLLERVRTLPGVQSASVAGTVALGGSGSLGRAFLAEGQQEPPAGQEVQALWNVVSPEHFRTLGVPLAAGRDFTARDDSAGVPVTIVSQRFARIMFPGQDPIGKRVRSWRDENVLREIVGVAPDILYAGPGRDEQTAFYVPHEQDRWRWMTLHVRAARNPESLLPAVRRELATLDPDLALADVSTMERTAAATLARPRFTAFMLGAFALLALILAAVGIYGVLSYAVSRRTAEIGVRMALGARARDVSRLVVREVLGVVLPSVAAGLVGALLVGRAMRSLLYGSSGIEPWTFAAVALLLSAVALLAAWVPARRAARVSPVTALRYE